MQAEVTKVVSLKKGGPTWQSLISNEVAIFPAAVSINLFTRLLIRTFSDVEKAFLFSDLAVKAAKSDNKKAFQHQRRLGFTGCLVDI